ncbi:MAG TPA: hypothetical protein VG820_00130 [Fimbriimonadaceae bacterium]|nr:hypothetical protein [Fimbriimonadaceae bacterium]
MLSLLAAATVVKLAYSFPLDVKRTYDVKTSFEGYIPLLSGVEGKVEVNLVMTAQGVKADAEGNAQVLGTLDDIKVLLNGEVMSLVTLDMVKPYFPPTTVSISPVGETLKTNAPDLPFPVKLPGLDIKRIPDITYLPVQLPTDGAEAGKSYTFKRVFGDSDMAYTATPTKVTDDTVELAVTVAQNYDVLESDSNEIVKDVKDAANKVATTLTGKGTATFDRHLGVFTNVSIDSEAHSIVTDLETKKDSTRDLKIKQEVKLRK